MQKNNHLYDDEIRKKGYRLTPQRTMVLEAIEHAEGHISAEEIHAQIIKKYPNVNISTVYRTLELLNELALVTATNMGDDTLRFHIHRKSQHHHLVCNACGNVYDISEEDLNNLKNSLMANYGFAAELRHIAFFGKCTRCVEKK